MRTPLANYVGTQEAYEDLPAIPLWTLNQDIPGHPSGSTVAYETMEEQILSQLKPHTLPVWLTKAINLFTNILIGANLRHA